MSKRLKLISKHSLDVQEEVLKEVLRRKYKKSLYATCKYLLGMKDVNWRTHGEMIANLESPTIRKLIVMPRGTLKSSIGVVGYTIWLLINNPNLRILIDSEVYNNSRNFIREIKAHLESDKFRELFGDWKGTVWSEGEIIVKARTIHKKEASVVAGGINTVKVGQHFDAVIHDDLNSGNNSNTSEACEKVRNHFKLNLAILDPGGIATVIGTRYSKQDCIQMVLDWIEEDRKHALQIRSTT